MEKIVRVNMTDLSVSEEPYPQEWLHLGGRALTAKILLREVDPACDPLGAANKLVFAPGALTGSIVPTSGRTSVGAKSPLTRGIKEANSGGQPGQQLARLGIRALVIEGKPKDPEKRYLLDVSAKGIELRRADDLKGLRNYAAAARLGERYPKRASFILVGPAGEARRTGATVAFTDKDNRYPSRHAARGGLGAVLGAKGLKAIAIDDTGTQARAAADAEALKRASTEVADAYREGPQLFKQGTAGVVPLANMMSSFPTRNRHAMQFDHAMEMSGEVIVSRFAERGGAMHNCLAGCIVQCSNLINDPSGSYVTSALEFETIALLGSNCEVADLDAIARLDRLCDELGLDTIETGGAFAVAMDAGKLAFGDSARMIEVLDREVEAGTELGRAIADGVVATARAFGVERVPAVRGQGLPAWEPRTLPATGITYATSAMGADHTAGIVATPPPDMAQASQEIQIVCAVCDAMGLCQFLGANMRQMKDLLNGLYGTTLSDEDVAEIGWQCLQDEWEFNRRAGMGEEAGRLPAWMSTEPVPSTGQTFNVPPEELKRVYTRIPPSELFFMLKPAG